MTRPTLKHFTVIFGGGGLPNGLAERWLHQATLVILYVILDGISESVLYVTVL